MQTEDNEKKGKLRVAVEDYKAALALDPNHVAHNVHLHFGLCKLLVKLGRGKDALNSCTEVLTIDGRVFLSFGSGPQFCLFNPTLSIHDVINLIIQ